MSILRTGALNSSPNARLEDGKREDCVGFAAELFGGSHGSLSGGMKYIILRSLAVLEA
jgi:hypothetical protein